MSKKRIAVYCGSSKGNNALYENEANHLAHLLVKHDYGMVYGGGSIGLMGVLADVMMAQGGEVIGIIPKKIYDWEVGHGGITKLVVVRNMHERKSMMAKLADGFIALPGGIGTLEEIIEILTWKQLGYHQKPCVIVNTNGYYDSLITFLDQAIATDFLKDKFRNDLLVANNADEAINHIIKLV